DHRNDGEHQAAHLQLVPAPNVGTGQQAWTYKRASGRYQGLYRDRRGIKQTVGTYTHESEALRQAAIKEDEQRRPGSVDVRAGKLLFGAWVDVVWDDRKVEPGTLGRDKSRLDRHILPCWQTVELGAIERDMVQEWVDELTNAKAANGAPKYAPATVHRIYSVFSAIMKTAVLGKKIGVSPCQSIELPVIPPADEYYLEEEEFEDLLACTPGEKNKLFLKIKVRTGMRWGEIVALHRHRVFPKQKR